VTKTTLSLFTPSIETAVYSSVEQQCRTRGGGNRKYRPGINQVFKFIQVKRNVNRMQTGAITYRKLGGVSRVDEGDQQRRHEEPGKHGEKREKTKISS
jgi:hypothetical protein